MRTSIRFLPLVVAAMVAIGSCGQNEPTGPEVHTIQGHVVLTGYLVHEGGAFAGTKLVGDADGVMVELLFADRVVGRVPTVDGVYRFPGVPPGYYIARTNVVGLVGDTTEALTVATTNVAVRDTLKLQSRGDLFPVPNPIGLGTSIFFQAHDSGLVRLEIHDLSMNVVRTLVHDEAVGTGLTEVQWDGRDDHGAFAPQPMFWAIYRSGADLRAQLLFR